MQVERKLHSIKPIFIKKKQQQLCFKHMHRQGLKTVWQIYGYVWEWNALWQVSFLLYSFEWPLSFLPWPYTTFPMRKTNTGRQNHSVWWQRGALHSSRARINTQAQYEWHPLGLCRECGDSDVLNAYNIPHKALTIILTPRRWRLMGNWWIGCLLPSLGFLAFSKQSV